jgi:hypothetical protein
MCRKTKSGKNEVYRWGTVTPFCDFIYSGNGGSYFDARLGKSRDWILQIKLKTKVLLHSSNGRALAGIDPVFKPQTGNNAAYAVLYSQNDHKHLGKTHGHFVGSGNVFTL